VHLTNLVGLAGVVQHTLSGGRLHECATHVRQAIAKSGDGNFCVFARFCSFLCT
jgi:uncharacterized protein (DUF1810 family)